VSVRLFPAKEKDDHHPTTKESILVEIPFHQFSFCPVCGGRIINCDNPMAPLHHIRECLASIGFQAPTIPSTTGQSLHLQHSAGRSPPPEHVWPDFVDSTQSTTDDVNADKVQQHACETCGKVYNKRKYLDKHRFFCSSAVSLLDYDMRNTQQSKNDSSIESQDPSSSHIATDRDDEFVLSSIQEEENSEGVAHTVLSTKDPLAQEDKKISEVPTYSCTVCKKVFKRATYLRRHVESIHVGVKTHNCPHCTKSFKDRTALKNHVKGHTNERPFSCGMCSKSFRRKESLIYHENSHRSQRPFLCSHCSKSFRNLRDLKNHEGSHANKNGGGKQDCPICSLTFRTKPSLTDHMATVHGVETPGVTVLTCAHCSKRFTSASQLEVHMRTHTGIKPFKCQYCVKQFRRNSHRNLHEKRHNRSGDYRCSLCNTIFPQESELRKHSLVHSANHRHKCNICSKTFSREETLKQHLQKHDLVNKNETEAEASATPLLQPTPLQPIQPIQTMHVKTEKFKTMDDTITTKTVYVMEPDVPGCSSPPIITDLRIPGNAYLNPYTLGLPHLACTDKEIGARIVIPAGKSNLEPLSPDHQMDPITVAGGSLKLTDIRIPIQAEPTDTGTIFRF